MPRGPKTDASAGGSNIDLLVLEGSDAGKRFTFDEAEIGIGRDPASGICLCDASVSPRHAVLRMRDGQLRIERDASAAGTLAVNDVSCSHGEVRPGDRIRVGDVLLEVQVHQGMSLRGLLGPLPPAPQAGAEVDASGASCGEVEDDAGQTLLRPVSLVTVERGHLEVIQGQTLVDRPRYDLGGDVTTIGRSAGSDIVVSDRGVSRAHAELVWEDGALVLIQKSPQNYTFVNGERILVSRTLAEGDVIQIADVLVLQVGGLAKRAPIDSGRRAFGDLSAAMEARLRLERQIEVEFMRRGSMLDVDVAGSSEMKEPGTSPAHIILSFERFRDYVARCVQEFGGVVLNSNGDELMCFFEDTPAAVRAGSAILERLPEFNRTQNLLRHPFRFRIGIHTGDCLVDLVNGRAFSSLVDLAGHLQKAAPIDGLLVSADTLAALPDSGCFEPAGVLERHGIEVFRLARFVPA